METDYGDTQNSKERGTETKVWKKVKGENRAYEIENRQVLKPKKNMGDYLFTFILSYLKTQGRDKRRVQNFNQKN